MCVFPSSIFAYAHSVFVLLFYPLVMLQTPRFGTPKRSKIDPKLLRNRVPILTRLRVQICLVLGALWAPPNRYKIASRALWAHLAVLQLHLGDLSFAWEPIEVSSCPFWVLLGPFGPTRRTIFASFWSLVGQFGPHQGPVWYHGRGIFEAFSCR